MSLDNCTWNLEGEVSSKASPLHLFVSTCMSAQKGELQYRGVATKVQRTTAIKSVGSGWLRCGLWLIAHEESAQK